MPKRSFIITVENDGATDLEVAEDIFDAVDSSGYDVFSVNPHGGTAPTITPTGPDDTLSNIDPLSSL